MTHDQGEAMAISDRVIIVFDGRIRQIGTRDELYRNPVDLDAAWFLSQPYLNVVTAKDLREVIEDWTRLVAITVEANLFVRAVNGGDTYIVRIASEKVASWPQGKDGVLHFAPQSSQVFDAALTTSRHRRDVT